jgi:hypothetical protein
MTGTHHLSSAKNTTAAASMRMAADEIDQFGTITSEVLEVSFNFGIDGQESFR